jgi:poly(3-hydroxybutyrate) depolymerase
MHKFALALPRLVDIGADPLLYQAYEMTRAALRPYRGAAQATRQMLQAPSNPFAMMPGNRAIAAACEVFEGVTKHYGKPDFGIADVNVDGAALPVMVTEVNALEMPFGNLLHFVRDPKGLPKAQKNAPKVLIVAPMSGHYATLLRGTVRAMLRNHDVYITDWNDAREVPLSQGRFDLDDYIEYLMTFIKQLGPDLHVMAVCQPGPAAIAATALLAEANDPAQPATLTLMGSPVDARKSPTVPNDLATSRELHWFEENVVYNVPLIYPGAMRRVYPGFLQLTGFMTMNMDRHIDAHMKLYDNLVTGDGDSVEQHKRFYDEYLSVMDMTAEFYIDTIERIFQTYDLADGKFMWRGQLVKTDLIKNTALMTVEGENDDISGIGQTQAAHDICSGLPDDMKADWVQPGVGHYGVFNGRRWREEIQPRVSEFIQAHPKSAKV